MLLDKLGLSAQLGIQLVIRQTLYGLWFALVNRKLEPTPNYWLTVMFRILVGSRVLDLWTIPASGSIRIYAHCGSHKVASAFLNNNNKDSVVIYAMNLLNTNISLGLYTDGSDVFEY